MHISIEAGVYMIMHMTTINWEYLYHCNIISNEIARSYTEKIANINPRQDTTYPGTNGQNRKNSAGTKQT